VSVYPASGEKTGVEVLCIGRAQLVDAVLHIREIFTMVAHQSSVAQGDLAAVRHRNDGAADFPA
jgi:hypothetical protein